MKHTEMGYIIRISRAFSLYRKTRLPQNDLGPSQLMFISHICRQPGATQEELSDSLFLDKTTVSRLVTKLEGMGYLKREISQKDARYKELYPTEKALDLYPALRQTYHDFFMGLLEDVSDEERTIVSQTLEKMYNHAVEMSSKDAKDNSKQSLSERKPL